MTKHTLLQINATGNWGSTGKIAEQINQTAAARGWETYFAYGRADNPCQSKTIIIGNKLQVYEHYAEHRLFDNDGLASRLATKQLVNRIEGIKPDIIHLHNIHDHWLNYRILFECLNTLTIPIVWTQHDCWSFTGGCAHFSMRGCYRWRDGGCSQGCPMKQSKSVRHLFEKTKKHYDLKKRLFTATKNMTIIPVSHWLEDLERQSFLNTHRIITIHNGIDISTFCPTDAVEVKRKYGIGEEHYVIGVSSVWLPYKGWDDFLKLSEILPSGVKLVMVGLNKEQMVKASKHNILGIPRTENVQELAALYSAAMLFCNLTYQDNYPTTNLEAMSCGTPVLTYRTGGSVEAISSETGWIVEQGDVAGVVKVIEQLERREEGEMLAQRRACRERAEKEFNKEDRYEEYMQLYYQLLKEQ
jgi:glycosyltransferase involved in cell wall biosynthesis